MTQDPLADFDAEILRFLQDAGVPPDAGQLSVPPKREFGERATNAALRLAREWRRAPRDIATDIAAKFTPENYRYIRRVEPAPNGFINVHLNYETFTPHVIEGVRSAGALYGRRPNTTSEQVVVEHTSVNPNKEWHIGHVRNAVLGDVVARLLRLRGDRVQVQNYIDDTGPQAAQAVVGLRDFPEERRAGEKYDQYVGRLYVKVAAELGAQPKLRERLEALERGEAESFEGEGASVRARLENVERLQRSVIAAMHALESGEYHDVTSAILDGQLETAYRFGVTYDMLAWESHLVQSHLFEQAMECIERSPVVYWAQEGRYAGAFVIRTGEPAEDGEAKSEVLIRSNGIPTYVGKDIAYHMWKFHLLPDRLLYAPYAEQPNGKTLWSTALSGDKGKDARPDRVVNIIGVHQSQAQDAVKSALQAAGFDEAADRLIHLAYGLVSTSEGKLSGRKGTSVSGDRVIDQAVNVALERVREKRSQDLSDDEMRSIAESVGIGAVRYFMVQYNPLREIVFDTADVVSYDGNTALYIQYALVRVSAILRKAASERGVSTDEIDGADATLLQHEQERRLIYHLAQYPGVISDASRMLAVNLVAEYAFDLATIFSQFYRDCAVLDAEPAMRNARLLLVRTVRSVLAGACDVLGVPVIERL
jgi:arginyl-tRNA synthetase